MHNTYNKRMQDLRFLQCEAEGALKGHVAFMLICHKRGALEERHWDKLQQYHDEAQQAALAILNHALQPVETMQ